jgi:drug/metabolite transporter (DMT)-like permease
VSISSISSAPSRRAVLSVCLAGVAWGLWWLPVRWLARLGLEGDLVSVAVYFLGALAVLPLVLFGARRHRANARSALIVGVLFGIAMATTNTALLYGQVVRVLLLFYLAPIWATLLNTFVLKVPIDPWRIAAVTLGLSGAAVVLGVGNGAGLPLPSSLGDWMGLGSGVGFAFGSLAIRMAHTSSEREAPHAAEQSPALQTCASFVVAGLVGLLFFIVLPTSATYVPAHVWSALPAALVVAALWLLPQMWLFAWGAARIDPGRVTILMLIEPLTAALSAGILLDEPLGWRELVGAALIVGAGAIESRPGASSKASVAAATKR